MRMCPRCEFALTPQTRGGVALDVCPRCQGSFFDPGEAALVLGADAEPQRWRNSQLAITVSASEADCPAGHGEMSTHRIKSPPDNGVDLEVDVCGECGGLWLDAWEAARLVQATKGVELSAREEGPRGVSWMLAVLFGK